MEEIFWVIKSNLWSVKAGGIDATTRFRPAVHDGLDYNHIAAVSELKGQLAAIEEIGCPKEVGNPRWSGAKKPTMHFVHLVDGVVNSEHHFRNSLTLGRPPTKARYEELVCYMYYLEKIFGCQITVSDLGWGDGNMEVGFLGR